MGRVPLFAAGKLPLDPTTANFLTNPTALRLNARDDMWQTTSVEYEGNCTCTGGAGSCTIPHGAGDHPAQPCVARWVAAVPPPSGFTAMSLTNMGEDPATVVTGFVQLGLPARAEDLYLVSDIWTGALIGTLPGNQTFTTALRMHASALIKVVAL